MRVLGPADYVTTPWRNGGGLTTEIAREGGGGGYDFLWRVSAAKIAADGPFSSFPGIDRLLVVTEGVGLDLSFAGGPVRRLGPDEVLAFAGEAACEGRLPAGPVRDLNVMVRRGERLGHLAIERTACRPHLAHRADEVVLAHALDGHWQIETEDGRARLAPGETLLAAGPESPLLTPLSAGRLALVQIVLPTGKP